MNDTNAYKEIGELYTEPSTTPVLGLPVNRLSHTRKQSLLSPDSDRLLYSYSSDPHIEDVARFDPTDDDNYGERFVFVGKNILTTYDSRSGNFHMENPKYLLSHLMDTIAEGGMGLTASEFDAVCANLKYVIAVNGAAYIVSYTVSGNPVLFKYDPYTFDVEAIAYTAFAALVGQGTLYCKPVDHNKVIYFLTCVAAAPVLYKYNTVSGELTTDASMTTGIKAMEVSYATGPGTMSMLIDKEAKRLYFISNNPTNSLRCYDLSTYVFLTVSASGIASGATISHAMIYPEGYNTNFYIAVLTQGNVLTLLSQAIPTPVITKLTFSLTNGVIGFIRAAIYHTYTGTYDNQYAFFILAKNSEGDIGAYPILESTLSTNSVSLTDSVVDLKVPFLAILSNALRFGGSYYSVDNVNLLFGSYLEAGVYKPCIKDLGVNVAADTYQTVTGRCFKSGIEKDATVSLVKGVEFGKTQMPRLHLHPQYLGSNVIVTEPDSTEVYFRETKSDATKYATGQYIWKCLAKLGLPYNTHVETIGRLTIDGFVIPITKTLITKSETDTSYGDILFTFDRCFNASILGDTLAEGSVQYPGALFLKNKGFLSDAMISNSQQMEGSLIYDDRYSKYNLFGTGLFEVTASLQLDDTTLLVASNFGSLASVNVKTGGYMNSGGTAYGDDSPIYCRPTTSFLTYGDIKEIILWESKIYLLFSSGRIQKTVVGSNSWTDVVTITASNLSLDLGVCVKDNLVLIPHTNGSISSFDLDSEVYTPYTSAGLAPSTTLSDSTLINSAFVASSQCKLGSRIYFIGSVSGLNTSKYLCWFDTTTNTFGYANESATFASTHLGAQLCSDGAYVYIIGKSTGGTSVKRYNPMENSFEPLASMPMNGTSCGAYYYDGYITVPFGISGGVKYLMVYSIATNIWFSYALTNTASLPVMYDAKGVIQSYTENGVKKARVCLFWGNDPSLGSGAASMSSNLVYVDLTARGSAIANSVSVDVTALATRGLTDKRQGYSVFVENQIAYIIGGLNLTTSAYATDIIRFSLDTGSVISTVDAVKPVGSRGCVGAIVNDRIYSIGGYIGTTGAVYATDSVYLYSLRTGVWSKVAGIAFNNTAPSTFISSMKVVGEKNLAVISHANGAISSIDLRTGTYIAAGTTGATSIDKIFAAVGEYFTEGAVTIDEDDEDIFFQTPTRTVRFAKNIGCFFSGEYDAEFTDVIATPRTDYTQYSDRSPKKLAGASQVAIGRYIVFMNGYDHFAADWKSTLHRGVVVYDTKYDDFTVLAEGANDTDISGTVRAKYDAYSIYDSDGYIYTFGGKCKQDVHIDGVTYTVYRRTNAIERYDLFSGTVTELDITFGIDTPIVRNESLGGNVPAEVGMSQIANVGLFSKWSTASDDKKRYAIACVTMNATDEESITDVNAVVQTMKSWVVIDMMTETAITISGLSASSMDNQSVFFPVERYTSDGIVELYIVEYALKQINVYSLSSLGVLTLRASSKAVVDATYLWGADGKPNNVVSPFYDDVFDAVIIPDVRPDAGGLATISPISQTSGTLSFLCQANTIGFTRFDSNRLMWGSQKGSYRIIPTLVLSTGKLCAYSHSASILNIEDKSSYVPYSKTQILSADLVTTQQENLSAAFALSSYDLIYGSPSDMDVTTYMSEIDNVFYRALLIKAVDTDTYAAAIAAELGYEFTSGSYNLVILKLDTASGLVSIASVYRDLTGDWSFADIFNNTSLATCVSDGILWVLPGIVTVDGDACVARRSLPSVAFSFDPSASSDIHYHDMVSATYAPRDYSSSKTGASIVVDSVNHNVHIITKTREATSDMFLIDCTRSAHNLSSDITVEFDLTWPAMFIGTDYTVKIAGYVNSDNTFRLYACINVNQTSSVTVDADARLLTGSVASDGRFVISNPNVPTYLSRMYDRETAFGNFVKILGFIESSDSEVKDVVMLFARNNRTDTLVSERIISVLSPSLYSKFNHTGYGTSAISTSTKDKISFIYRNTSGRYNVVFSTNHDTIDKRIRLLANCGNLAFDSTISKSAAYPLDSKYFFRKLSIRQSDDHIAATDLAYTSGVKTVGDTTYILIGRNLVVFNHVECISHIVYGYGLLNTAGVFDVTGCALCELNGVLYFAKSMKAGYITILSQNLETLEVSVHDVVCTGSTRTDGLAVILAADTDADVLYAIMGTSTASSFIMRVINVADMTSSGSLAATSASLLSSGYATVKEAIFDLNTRKIRIVNAWSVSDACTVWLYDTVTGAFTTSATNMYRYGRIAIPDGNLIVACTNRNDVSYGKGLVFDIEGQSVIYTQPVADVSTTIMPSGMYAIVETTSPYGVGFAGKKHVYQFGLRVTGTDASGASMVALWTKSPKVWTNNVTSKLQETSVSLWPKRTFTYKGQLYLYSKSEDHCVWKWDPLTRAWSKITSALHALTDLVDANVIGIKSYLDGEVKVASLRVNTSKANSVYISFITFNITTGIVSAINHIAVDMTGASSTILNVIAGRAVWTGKKFLCVLSLNAGTAERTLVYANLLTYTVATCASTSLPSNGPLEAFDKRIYAINGNAAVTDTLAGTPYSAIASDTKGFFAAFDTFSSRAYAANVGTIIPRGPLVKSGNRLVGSFSRDQSTAVAEVPTLFKNVVSIGRKNTNPLSANLAVEASLTDPNTALIKSMANDTFQHAAFFKAANAWSDYQFPVSDNEIYFGYLTAKNACTLPQVVKVSPSPMGVYTVGNFRVHVYSGATKDRYVVVNPTTLDIVSSLDVERDYGITISRVLVIDDTTMYVMTDGGPTMGSVIIHDTGEITVKRYDGEIFGKAIDASTNIHTIQDLDLTFLFDVESSEQGMRVLG